MTHLDWHFGMKVVYIGGSFLYTPRSGIRRLFGKFDKTPSSLVVGAVYEISRIDIGPDRITGIEEVGVELKDDPDGQFDGLYAARCFRPVQTKKTSIAIFTALLNTQDELEEVPFQ